MKIQKIVPIFLFSVLLITGCSSPVKVSEVELPDTTPVVVEEVPGETVDNQSSETSQLAPEGEGEEVISYDGDYALVVEDSTVGWVGKKIGGEHSGVVDLSSGDLSIKDGVGAGTFVLDMTTISTTDLEGPSKESMDAHLKNDDFFGVESHPQATIILKDIDVVTGGVVEVNGDLTIKGITNPITFPATFKEEGDLYTVNADFEIDRTLWDIRYGSGKFFSDIGDKAIKDEIGMSLELVLKKQ